MGHKVGIAAAANRVNMPMAERDANQEALGQVEKATDSESVRGEDLLESPELNHKLDEAREKAAV